MRLDKLQYQQDAINAVVAAINQANIATDENACANPILNFHHVGGQRGANIDVKMETGTGKTYVYTRLMHEMKRQYGFFKFIIIVPSLPIKEGTKMSILSDDWNKHFRQEFNNQSITLGVVNAGDFNTKKGKRKQIPEALRSFCDNMRAEANSVQVLLVNDAMLASTSMTSDYDSTLFGSITRPLDGLKATRPIVIIDEPHRFKKGNVAWKNITEGLNPQLIVRFGATFPEITVGKGKLKETKKDYENLVYDLNSVRAFNDGLVKGVSIQYPAIPNIASNGNILKCKVKSINKDGNKFVGATFSMNGVDKEVPFGESLSVVNENFGSLELDMVGRNPTLSNGLQLYEGMTLLPQVYGESYQDIMLGQALDAHFKKEKENFTRKNRIKTNSLFFIDSVASFRGENPVLRRRFETLLIEKTQAVIADIDTSSTIELEYKSFLEQSLKKNDKGEMLALAGYFAQDNGGDEDIQKEVDLVLRDKEQSLKFKNERGEWNVCRFFFSKWTLCEGWDNPNVFVIAKLRSSGSEMRKLQEVGRGLRLPFDENGNRISDEEFYLTYIIDYSEREFARKLVGEINADGGVLSAGKITEHVLELLVKAEYATSLAKAKGKLLLDDVINDKDTILDSEKLLALLPEDSGLKVKAGRIIGEDLPQKPMVRLNKANFTRLKELWQQVTKRYLLHFNEVGDNELNALLGEVITKSVFALPYAQIVEQHVERGEGAVSLREGGFQSRDSSLSEIPYGEFLKRLNRLTNLPINMLHKNIITALKDENNVKEKINLVSLDNIAKVFEEKFTECFAQRYDYEPLDFTARTSLFKPNGEFKDELPEGDLGKTVATGVKIDRRYLYDKVVYDSEIEREVLNVSPNEKVVVYGKLPKRCIKVPTYTGGTTSPDFVYAISKDGGQSVSLHLIVETKSDNLRMSDDIAIEAQGKLFRQMSNIEWLMETDVAKFERDLKELCKRGVG